jgi:hypothetical protein
LKAADLNFDSALLIVLKKVGEDLVERQLISANARLSAQTLPSACAASCFAQECGAVCQL